MILLWPQRVTLQSGVQVCPGFVRCACSHWAAAGLLAQHFPATATAVLVSRDQCMDV